MRPWSSRPSMSDTIVGRAVSRRFRSHSPMAKRMTKHCRSPGWPGDSVCALEEVAGPAPHGARSELLDHWALRHRDHPPSRSPVRTTGRLHEGWTPRCAPAAPTERLRPGLPTTGNRGRRPPAVLGRAASTVVVISGGDSCWASAWGGTRQSPGPGGIVGPNPAFAAYDADRCAARTPTEQPTEVPSPHPPTNRRRCRHRTGPSSRPTGPTTPVDRPTEMPSRLRPVVRRVVRASAGTPESFRAGAPPSAHVSPHAPAGPRRRTRPARTHRSHRRARRGRRGSGACRGRP